MWKRLLKGLHSEDRNPFKEGDLFYGDVEIYRASRIEEVKGFLVAMKGLSDTKVLLSKEYQSLRKMANEDPEEIIRDLKSIRENYPELAPVIRVLLRKFAHSENEALRTFAFGEL